MNRHHTQKEVACFSLCEAKVVTEDGVEESVHHTIAGVHHVASSYEEKQNLARHQGR